MWKGRICKGVFTFFLYLSIYTYMCIGGVGMVLELGSPIVVASMSAWHSAAVGAVSIACINGVWVFGSRLDRIVASEDLARQLRSELLTAWRR